MSNRPDHYLPHSQEMSGFLHAIKEDPQDPTPRLIFADWLEEQGDPRGEWLRLQAEKSLGNSQSEKDTAREAELTRTFKKWLSPRPPWITELKLEGMLISIRIGVGRSLKRRLTSLSKLEWWPWVSSLNISQSNLAEGEVVRLAEWQDLQGLTLLDLANCQLKEPDMASLAESPYVRNLRSLLLWHNHHPGAKGAHRIFTSAYLSKLRLLNLGGSEMGHSGIQVLANESTLENLALVYLWRNKVDDECAELIAGSPRLSKLTSLGLTSNEIGDRGAIALAKSQTLQSLTWLHLQSNKIGKAGATALAESPYLQHITTLNLTGNSVGKKAAERVRARFMAQCNGNVFV